MKIISGNTAESNRESMGDVFLSSGFIKAFCERRIFHGACFVDLLFFFISEYDFAVFYFDITYILFFYHTHKLAVINFGSLLTRHHRHYKHVEKQQ